MVKEGWLQGWPEHLQRDDLGFFSFFDKVVMWPGPAFSNGLL